ncbi:CHASE3 domain-containing protein [Streptomyces sp. KL116D]|uniref:CHASE3 domain-containing protein n=1 Tax=Streptomyces sp. KL116D TaxID=3045152 RepID=UPI0035561B6F
MRGYRGRQLGLTRLTIVASSLFALLIGVAFTVLLWAIADANSSVSARRASRTALVKSGSMEQIVLDLETGQRGFVITGKKDFLEPWTAARKAFPAEARRFTASVTSPEQRRIAAEITKGVRSYLNDYSVPLVDAVRRGDRAASGAAVAVEGANGGSTTCGRSSTSTWRPSGSSWRSVPTPPAPTAARR